MVSVIRQQVEAKVLRRIPSNTSKRDKALTELVSRENIEKARGYFSEEARFRNSELGIIYSKVIGRLLEELVVQEDIIVPRRIVDPDDEDKKYLELYSALVQLDQSFVDYRTFLLKNSTGKSNIGFKIQSAQERLETVGGKLKGLREELSISKSDKEKEEN
jgi:hypothetical protein